MKASGHIAMFFFDIFGTSKQPTKSGPSDPLFITEILQNIQDNYGNILQTYYFCKSGNLNFGRFLKPRVPTCSKSSYKR